LIAGPFGGFIMATSAPISVALCTFNGAAFLTEQLRSIASQTIKPAEVVVFDDGSTDRTMEILDQFAKSGRGFEVRITSNQHRLGPTANFGQAIAACQGQIIALCDQDDLWMPDKLETIYCEFQRCPDLLMAFSDAEICDEACEKLGYRLWESVGLAGRLRRKLESGRAFEVILRQNVVTGTTMAFAAELRELVLPIDPLWVHDGWIGLLAAAVGRVSAIPRPLVRYRQHTSQAIGALRRSFYQQYLNAKKMDGPWFGRQADMYQAAATRLDNPPGGSFTPSARNKKLLNEKVRHFRRRSEFHGRGLSRFLPSVGEFVTFRYRRYSLGWKSFAQDLFL
jgi:glycosyltransferase involved in cell wall biosynthesis